jgi:ubiquinone biosynthesis protein UbiJ
MSEENKDLTPEEEIAQLKEEISKLKSQMDRLFIVLDKQVRSKK